MIEGFSVSCAARKSVSDVEVVKSYIIGCVYRYYDHCEVNEIFSVRLLFGGEKKNWNGTPLQNIYDHYIGEGKNDKEAKKLAAIDVGYLLRQALAEDKTTTFVIRGKDSGYLYSKK